MKKRKTAKKAAVKTSLGDFLVWAEGRYDLWYMVSLARNEGDNGWMFQWRELPGGISDSEILKSIPSRKYKK
ncbi:MAG: hypothetical protein NT118_05655 [Lentisphaerae bacterium]|nr:hypothetical protein [Lentisphaerota bacterium]